MIQRYILHNHYIYVAAAFDAEGNHPTSNPSLLFEVWLRLAAGNGLPDDFVRWERIKQTLGVVLLDSFLKGEITLEKLEEGQRIIATATIQLTTPLLFVIPHSDSDYVIQPGDKHEGYEATEEEYLIPNLNPEFQFEIRVLR
jgi:hypothetical protein